MDDGRWVMGSGWRRAQWAMEHGLCIFREMDNIEIPQGLGQWNSKRAGFHGFDMANEIRSEKTFIIACSVSG
jgi:hypothetical protein